MRPYVELATAEFRRYATYRLAILAGIVTQSIFGLLRAGVLMAAIVGAGGSLAGYDQRSAATYVWLGQALLGVIPMFAWQELAQRVRTGDIAVDLARPVDLQLAWWAGDLGRAAVGLMTRSWPIMLLGALIMPLALPASWWALPLGVISLLLGLAVNFLCRYGMNLISLWTLDIRGFMIFYMLVMNLLSGFYVPVHIFPDWLRVIAQASPFPAMFQSPIDVLSGRVTGVVAGQVLGVQMVWVLVLVAVTRLIWWRGSRRLVVQGG